MKRRIVVEQAAEEDLVETAMYILQNQPAAATRFISAARASFERLLLAGLDSGESKEMTKKDWDDIRCAVLSVSQASFSLLLSG